MSAQDLALVSKSMKTYAVAWIDPERKLTTRVDQSGLTGPVWNDKFVFRVDDKFLNDEESTIMIEIYAAAWIKDALIGSVRVLVSHLFGSLYNNSSSTRYVALQVRRPSGRPQGILNMGITLLDSSLRSMPLFAEICASGATNLSDITTSSSNVRFDKDGNVQKKVKDDQEIKKVKPTAKLRRSQSDRTDLTSEEYTAKQPQPATPGPPDSMCNGDVAVKKVGSGSMVNGSICSSDVGPSASVVAAAIAKGLYQTPTVPVKAPAAEDDGSLLTEQSEEGLHSKLERWRTELPPTYDSTKIRANSKHAGKPRRRATEGGGLFSCFGNAFGCEISITCGGGNSKRRYQKSTSAKKKNANGKVCHLSSVDDNYSESYV